MGRGFANQFEMAMRGFDWGRKTAGELMSQYEINRANEEADANAPKAFDESQGAELERLAPTHDITHKDGKYIATPKTAARTAGIDDLKAPEVRSLDDSGSAPRDQFSKGFTGQPPSVAVESVDDTVVPQEMPTTFKRAPTIADGRNEPTPDASQAEQSPAPVESGARTIIPSKALDLTNDDRIARHQRDAGIYTKYGLVDRARDLEGRAHSMRTDQRSDESHRMTMDEHKEKNRKIWESEGVESALQTLETTGDVDAAIEKFDAVGKQKVPENWRGGKYDRKNDSIITRDGQVVPMKPYREMGMSFKDKEALRIQEKVATATIAKNNETSDRLWAALAARGTAPAGGSGGGASRKKSEGGDDATTGSWWGGRLSIKDQKAATEYIDSVLKESEPIIGKDGKTPVDKATARVEIGSDFARIAQNNDVADADTAMRAALEISRKRLSGKPLPSAPGFDKNSGTWREQVALENGSVVNVSAGRLNDEQAIQAMVKSAGVPREKAVEFVQAKRDDYTTEQAGLYDAIASAPGMSREKVGALLRLSPNPELRNLTVDQFYKKRDDLLAMREGITQDRASAAERLREQSRPVANQAPASGAGKQVDAAPKVVNGITLTPSVGERVGGAVDSFRQGFNEYGDAVNQNKLNARIKSVIETKSLSQSEAEIIASIAKRSPGLQKTIPQDIRAAVSARTGFKFHN